VAAALKNCRAEDKGPNSYVVLGYANPNTLHVVAQGEGGLEEASKAFTNEDAFYAILRKDWKVEMAKTVKFAFVDLTPEGLKTMRRTQVTAHKKQVQDLLTPWHVLHQASDKSDLEDKQVVDAIAKASGTAIFETGKQAPKEAAKSSGPAPAKKAEWKPKPKEEGAGGEPKPAARPVQAGSTSAGVKLADEAAFKEAMKKIKNDKDDTNWFLAVFSGKDTLTFVGTGTDGAAGLVAKFEDDKVNFGLVRVTEVIDKSRTTKFCFIKLQPESIKPMEKANISVKDGAIKALYQPFHVDVAIAKKEELSDEMIMDRVASASGTKSNVKGAK